MMNLFEVFRETARRHPDHAALIDGDRRDVVSYRELLQEVEQFAAQLSRAGVRAGDCIGLHVPSGRNYLVATYALWQCGACVVPIPIELTACEKQLVCSKIALDAVVSSALAVGTWESWQRGDAVPLGPAELIPTEPSRARPAEFNAVNAAFIRFSSGTTGDAKGVVLSHETIFDRIHAANTGLQLTPADRVVWLLSMSYHFAVSLVAYLTFGSSVILPKRSVTLGRAIIQAAQQHGGTLIYGSPQQYDLMAQDRSHVMLETLRVAVSTAMSLPRETADAFYRRFRVPLSQAYGLIEVGLPCMNLRYAHEHFDSVGQVLPAFELRLAESGFGSGLKEIQLRGSGFLDAYYDPWQTREQIMHGGWFCTGDLGELDENGCLFIRGRSKEMINVGGMKVFPREVEAVLASHPDVKAAAVFAVNCMHSQESVHAHVVARQDATTLPTESELRQFCAKRLAHFKVPQRIQFVPQLARTASGKVLRRAVESA